MKPKTEMENEYLIIHFPQEGKSMEKISIVRRRKDGAFKLGGERHSGIDSHSLHGQELIEIPASVLSQTLKYMRKQSRTLEVPVANINDAISINLTPEQYDLVKSNRYVKYFLNGDNNGRIFRYTKAYRRADYFQFPIQESRYCKNAQGETCLSNAADQQQPAHEPRQVKKD